MNAPTNPFEELERLFERMSQQFDDASHRLESDGPLAQLTSGLESMAVDLVERDDEFVATIDLPGFEHDDVDIRVTDHTLRIDAERAEGRDESNVEYLHRERRHESHSRSMRLPAEVDTDAVTARMKKGVLTVTLPKRELSTASSIEIQGE